MWIFIFVNFRDNFHDNQLYIGWKCIVDTAKQGERGTETVVYNMYMDKRIVIINPACNGNF